MSNIPKIHKGPDVSTGVPEKSGPVPASRRVKFIDYEPRIEEVGRISDPAKLRELYNTETSWKVRIAVVGRIDDKGTLAEIAIKDGDHRVCKAAIEKISDQAVLVDIYKKQRDIDVRMCASLKITDQAVLADIGRNDRSAAVRKYAIERVEDRAVRGALEEREALRPHARLALFEACRSNDAARAKEALAEGASVHDMIDDYKGPLHVAAESNSAAVVRVLVDAGAGIDDIWVNDLGTAKGGPPLADCAEAGAAEAAKVLIEMGADCGKALEEIRENIQAGVMREEPLQAVVEMIEETLNKVPKSGTVPPKVEKGAEKKLDDTENKSGPVEPAKAVKMSHEVLKTVDPDLDSLDWQTRVRAVERCDDQRKLEEIAKTDEDTEVRTAAVERLTDQAVIEEIEKTDEDADVRIAAVERMTDQTLLAKIAKMDHHWVVRRVAIQRLTDRKAITEIAKTDKVEFVRKAAKERLDELREGG